jgi:acetyl esterase/lipase
MKKKIVLILTVTVMLISSVVIVSQNKTTSDKGTQQTSDDSSSITTSYKTLPDITYCSPNGSAQLLDLYIPDKKSSHPLVIHVHGGSWTSGKKSSVDMLPYIETLAKAGIAVASINYRLAPNATFPSQIQDTACAIRFIRSKAADYNIDSDRIGIMGESAGGHLASLAGVSSDIESFKTSEYSDVSSKVSAVLSIFGPANLTSYSALNPVYANGVKTMLGASSTESASPTSYIDKTDPPFLLIHGDQDAIVPLSQSQELFSTLQNSKIASELVVVKNAGHGFTIETGDQIISSITVLKQKALDFFSLRLK